MGRTNTNLTRQVRFNVRPVVYRSVRAAARRDRRDISSWLRVAVAEKLERDKEMRDAKRRGN